LNDDEVGLLLYNCVKLILLQL